MGDQEVRFLGAWASPFSKSVEIALKMKGISYEYAEQDIYNKSPELLKYNPIHKKVPVLLHNGMPICESLVIIEYIDETWKSGPSILPKDPYNRAMARFWAKFFGEKCFPAIWKRRSRWEEEREKAIGEAMELLVTLENELKGKKFFSGDEIGLADIAADFVALWIGVVEESVGIKFLTEEKFPRLCEWIDIYLNTSIIKETLPSKEELLDRFRPMLQRTS